MDRLDQSGGRRSAAPFAPDEALDLWMEIGRAGWFARDYPAGLVYVGPTTRAMRYLPKGEGPVTDEVWFGSVYAEDRGPMVEQVRQTIAAQGAQTSLEYRVRDPATNDIHHHLVRCRYHYDHTGACERVLGVLIDITAQRRAELLLRMSLEFGKVGTFHHNIRDDTISYSEYLRSMFAIDEGETHLDLARWTSRVSAEDLEAFQRRAQGAFDRRDPEVTFHYRLADPKTGKVRFIDARAKIQYDESGAPIASDGVMIDVTDLREAQARLSWLAYNDPLTGLLNRERFRERLDAALRQVTAEQGLALLIVDLDRFKDVNDALGHSVGDALLQAVAQRLREAAGPSDILGRLGGDEFAVVQPGGHPEAAAALATRINRYLAAAFDLEGHRVAIGGSVGVALAPRDAPNSAELLKAADLALYEAKAAGRGGWRDFEPAMRSRFVARRTLARDLREALESEQFELVYQPIVGIASCRLTGLEALIRWRHPQRGLMLPGAFIATAEELGLIGQIGSWVVRRATLDAARWPNDHRVSVNLSALQLDDPHLEETILQALQASRLDPARLVLEITETAMLRNAEPTFETLRRLRGRGVRIALDDFGTGYSALGYLRTFRFDKLKLDRSFVHDVDTSHESHVIVRSVLEMCASLGVVTTAEGVETESQLQALRAMGCGEAQGFLFGEPRPVAELPAALDDLAARAARAARLAL